MRDTPFEEVDAVILLQHLGTKLLPSHLQHIHHPFVKVPLIVEIVDRQQCRTLGKVGISRIESVA
ncbi:hypothetical protein D1872_354140 [compost metagenome]